MDKMTLGVKKLWNYANNEKVFVISFISLLLFYFVPFYIGDAEVFKKPYCLCLLIIFLISYVCGNRGTLWAIKYKKQLLFFNVAIVLYFSVVLFNLLITRTYENKWELLCNGIMWLSGALSLLGLRKDVKPEWNRYKSFFVDNSELFLILLVAVILSVPTIDDFFRWDASLYYYVYDNMEASAIFHFREQTSFTHFSNGYSLIVLFFMLLTGSTGVGIRLTNIVLYISAVIASWVLIPQILKNKEKKYRVAATCIFAFSPYLFGIVGNISMDYPLSCLFLVLCALLYCEYDLWEIIVAWLFVFSKEPATVIYAGLMIGYLIKVYVEKGKRGVTERKALWINCVLLGITWCSFYIMNGGAAYGSSIISGNGGFNVFGIDLEYILTKAKVITVLNFNWLMVFIGVICILMNFKKDGKKMIISILPIITAGIMSLLFNFLFITHSHPRYIAIDSVIVMIIFVCALGYKRTKNRVSVLLCCFVSYLLLIQSYRSIDPLSNMVFENYSLANGKNILSVPEGIFSDTSVYNRQYTYLDEAIDLAIKEVLDKSIDPIIVFPCKNKEIGGYAWYVGGTWYPEKPIYWDVKNAARTLEENDKELRIEYVESAQELVELLTIKDEAFYFSLPYIYEDVLGQNDGIIKVEDIEYKGWNVQVYQKEDNTRH